MVQYMAWIGATLKKRGVNERRASSEEHSGSIEKPENQLFQPKNNSLVDRRSRCSHDLADAKQRKKNGLVASFRSSTTRSGTSGASKLRHSNVILCVLGILVPGYLLLLFFTVSNPSFSALHQVHWQPINRRPVYTGRQEKDFRENHGVVSHELETNALQSPDGFPTEVKEIIQQPLIPKRLVAFTSSELDFVPRGTTQLKREKHFFEASIKPENHVFMNETTISNKHINIDANDPNCVPRAEWQTNQFPTCNSLHEIDLFSFSPILSWFNPGFYSHNLQGQRNELRNVGKGTTGVIEENEDVGFIIPKDYTSKLLGGGWFRQAWSVSDSAHDFNMAIKTLRLERNFTSEFYELHRRDAVAMERLTSSPYVMDIYGFCGQSALTELAFFEKGINDLYRVSVGLKDVNTPYVLRTKLKIAAMTAMGVAHIHGVALDGAVLHGDGYNTDSQAGMAHYDINPRNVLFDNLNGKPKINDFNLVEFLTWDPHTKLPCGFDARIRDPWWRSPEEMRLFASAEGNVSLVGNGGIVQLDGDEGSRLKKDEPMLKLTEKVDVFSLGNVLYVLLTGLEPRGKDHKKQRYENVAQLVARGEYPTFPTLYSDSSDPVISSIRGAIIKCWEPLPDKRPSAKEIAHGLFEAAEQLKIHPEYSHDS